MRKLTANETSV